MTLTIELADLGRLPAALAQAQRLPGVVSARRR